MAKKIKKQKKKAFNQDWKKWSDFWSKIKPPWRPSAQELRFIKSRLKVLVKNNQPQALIQGATPGFRDLLADLGYQVWLLDINKEMVKGMSLVMKNKNPKEKAKIGNWLAKPFKTSYFDVVLADETLDNIALKTYNQYFQNIKTFLKPGGYFIYGAYCIPERVRQISFDELAKLYNKNPKFIKKWENKCYLWHWVQDKSKIFDRRKWQYDFSYFDKEIQKLYDQGKISKQGLKDLQYKMETYQSVHLYRKDLENRLKKHFRILNAWVVPKMKYHNKIVYVLKIKK